MAHPGSWRGPLRRRVAFRGARTGETSGQTCTRLAAKRARNQRPDAHHSGLWSLPAWSGGGTHRAIGTPKLAFVDTGLLCHLLGQGPTRLSDPGGAAGPVLENFVLMELARQLTWNDERATLWHYRTKDKVEVDAVLESADGRIIGIEVKAGATLNKHDFAGLRHLRDRVGDRFVAGFVLFTGQHSLPFGDRLRSLPIEALWRVKP